jgi:hypothetical protein
MWVFYHDVVSATVQIPNDVAGFALLTLVVGLIVLIPSFFESKDK